MNRFRIAQYIALGATAAFILGVFILIKYESLVGSGFLCAGIVASITSVIVGGLTTIKAVFGTAAGVAKNIGFFGLLAFVFPLNIVLTIMAFVLTLYLYLFVPIIPVSIGYSRYKRAINA